MAFTPVDICLAVGGKIASCPTTEDEIRGLFD